MKIAIAAEGTRGDIYPMLSLAERFEAAGHEVVFCAPPDFAAATAERGLRFHAVGQDIRAYLKAEAQALHGGPLAMAKAAGKLFNDNLSSQFLELRLGAAGCDVMISAGTQIAASSIAELLGVPHHYVAYDPALLPAASHTPVFCPFPDLPRWANRLLWRLQGKLLYLGLGRGVNREREMLGLKPVSDIFGLMLGKRPFLATDARLAPAPAELEGVHSLGCLHPFAEKPLPEKLDHFLLDGPPPVFIGFGSMTDPNPERSTRLLLDAIDRAGVRAVVSEGWAGLGGIALPNHVFVTGAVDHSTLFRRVSAVVHHGGAGTTTTAARAGTPQILVPHVLDQFHWAARVQRLGIAPPPLLRRKLTAEGLAYSLRAVCGNEWLADNAAELGEGLRLDLENRPDPTHVMIGGGLSTGGCARLL